MRKRSWTDKELEQGVKASKSMAEVCRTLGLKVRGGNYRTLKKHISRLALSTIHFENTLYRPGSRSHNKIDLVDLLKEGVEYYGWRLKQRLIAAGIKKDICERCGQSSVHNNKPLTLQLDHINGVHTDNRIENLRILCPNCHSQTETYGNKSKK